MPDPPKVIGVLLFPGFEVLDVAGPLEALNTLARREQGKDLRLRVIARTKKDVITPANPDCDQPGYAFQSQQHYVATDTFADVFATGPAIDLLLVPGGFGSLPPADSQPEIDFIKQIFPSLRYLFTVCTGAGLAARAGVLDGQNATTNKSVWDMVTPMGPQVNWVARARWVVSGPDRNIWTTSGVSAGTDGMFAFIGYAFDGAVMDAVLAGIEYNHEWDATRDKFSAFYNCSDVPPKKGSQTHHRS